MFSTCDGRCLKRRRSDEDRCPRSSFRMRWTHSIDALACAARSTVNARPYLFLK